MKQSEKLDIILRYLYERRDNRQEYNIAQILSESKVDTNPTEVSRLAGQLRDAKLIFLNDLSHTLKKARITAKGITYCEESSYSHKGQSVVNNYNIINSSNANIVVNSSQVDITQTTQDKAKKIINKIRDAVGNDESVKLDVRKEILECLTEIEAGVENNKAPKFAIKSLLGIGSDIASISSLLVSLAQLFGGSVA